MNRDDAVKLMKKRRPDLKAIPDRTIRDVLTAYMDIIAESLMAGEDVFFQGIGTLTYAKSAPRWSNRKQRWSIPKVRPTMKFINNLKKEIRKNVIWDQIDWMPKKKKGRKKKIQEENN